MDFSQRLKFRERYSHVRENEDGISLIDYMSSNFCRYTAEQWLDIIKQQKVYVNGTVRGADWKLKKHDHVSLIEDLMREPNANLSFKTVYEDDDLLVFNKPSDLCVHPTGAFYQNTLWYQAGKKYGEIFFVGRLDRETSGLIIGARSRKIAAAMQRDDFAIYKEYLVLLHGRFEKYVRAKGYLSRDENSMITKKRRFTFEECQNAEYCDAELFPVKICNDDISLVRAVLHTGRMHQIRATVFSLGFPVLGDKLYGLDETLYNKISAQSFTKEDMEKLVLPNQALHCSKLEFDHPATGEKISLTAAPEWIV